MSWFPGLILFAGRYLLRFQSKKYDYYKIRVEPLYAHTKRKLMTYTKRYINDGNNIILKKERMFEAFNWHNKNVR